ncbi:MAG: hypothetical protein CME64_07720 [Halobacteriovoraceae bacterium]|nr:hypothetical protein [Halobacteriovoraceae bacterium]|tara:strand:- start:88064 stop:88486 length:423 start_codon:yes stop_codon:yes gene_type:complete
MKKLICLTALLTWNIGFTSESDFDFECTDGTVKVEYTYQGEIPEVGELESDIFQNGNVVKITKGDKSYTYKKWVGIATDGFGNDLVQVYKAGGFHSLLEQVADFTFEHEGGYLEGTLVIEGEKYFLGEKFECISHYWNNF